MEDPYLAQARDRPAALAPTLEMQHRVGCVIGWPLRVSMLEGLQVLHVTLGGQTTNAANCMTEVERPTAGYAMPVRTILDRLPGSSEQNVG